MSQDEINFICQLIRDFVDFGCLDQGDLIMLEAILDKEQS